MTRITTPDGNAVVLLDGIYARDALGRITGIDGPAEDWTYAYDGFDRLASAANTAALTESFTYSPGGNLTSRTRMSGAYVYPASNAARPHAPAGVGARAFTYDANGNTLSDGLRTFTWDNDNRLASVSLGGNLTAFAYGPDGSRAQKSVTGPLASVTRYFGTGSEAKGSAFTRFPHPDVMVEGGVVSFMHRDHLASVSHPHGGGSGASRRDFGLCPRALGLRGLRRSQARLGLAARLDRRTA